MYWASVMQSLSYSIRAKVWLYPGKAGWHFITIPKSDADEIKKEYIWPRRGFNSIPVNVTISKTTWKTSIFPDKGSTYLLPLKKDVRIKEDIKTGDTITISLEVIT